MTSNDKDRGRAWIELIIFLVIIAVLGQSTHGSPPTIGTGNGDDGCASGVPQMGCFP